MANYSIVSNARFTPFSFDQMVKPFQMYGEYYAQNEALVSELSDKAALWENRANQTTDPIAYQQYKTYADDLKRQADRMLRQGMTPGIRADIQKMKKRYASEITPIEEAYQLRKALTEEQRKAMLADSSLMFSKNYNTVSLDELLNNPNATYQAISGNELTKRSAAMAAALAKTIQQDPTYNGIMNGQYIQSMQQIGYTPEQIVNTIMNDPTAPKELKQIAESVFNDSGLSNFDAESQARGRQFINQGLYNAIGTPKYDVIQDRSYVSPAEARKLAMEQERINLSREELRQKLAMEKERINLSREELKMAKDEARWKRTQNGNGNDKTVVAADGTTYKTLPGGNMLVTDTKGNSVVVNSSGQPIMVNTSDSPPDSPPDPEEQVKLISSFTPFFMKGWSDDSDMIISERRPLGYSSEGVGKNEVWQNGVTKAGTTVKGRDGIERNTFVLGSNAKAQIKSKLQEYNIRNQTSFTLDNVVVLRDQDAFSDNHYKVILKGMNENGDIIRNKDNNLDLNYWGMGKDPITLPQTPKASSEAKKDTTTARVDTPLTQTLIYEPGL